MYISITLTVIFSWLVKNLLTKCIKFLTPLTEQNKTCEKFNETCGALNFSPVQYITRVTKLSVQGVFFFQALLLIDALFVLAARGAPIEDISESS